MKSKLFAVIFFFGVLNIYAQERLVIKKLGFSMEIPSNWISVNNDEILKNLDNYDLSDKQLEELLKSNNSSFNISTYTKYDSKKYNGIIPTIKIRTILNNSSNSAEFLKFVQNSNESAKKALTNFRFIESPVIAQISNNDVVKFSVQFTLINQGKQYEIKSNSYYILRRGYYISLNFIEEIGKEDNSVLFEKLINSIELKK
ncbi:hypothetical protein [Flavobacterium chungnamense]|uniref:Uncharacterized protein n=1 Tax=Flavobacterium chungnamense TaxID=706182 RepID=A0ABP7V313_9FLAO